MHASIRHLLQHDSRRPWDGAALGIPINQEDLAGTLMTFSSLVLDGLAMLDLEVARSDQEAYLDAWIAVGRVMGIREELIPADVAEARALTALIQRRQIAPSQEGREMTAALLDMMEQNVARPFHALAPALVRHFLPPDVADDLGVPTHHIDKVVGTIVTDVTHVFDSVTNHSARRRAAFRAFSLHMIRFMFTVELGGQRAKFRLPETIQAGWKLAPADSQEGFLMKLGEWVRERL